MEKEIKVSVEKTEDSNYITILGNKQNLYIEIFKDGDIILSAFKDKNVIMNWTGTLNDLIKKLTPNESN